MSEEQTDRLEGGTPFEIRVLRELANINQRLNGLEVRLTRLEGKVDALEEKVESRLYDTRPIWESVLARLDSMDARLAKMDAKFDVVGSEMLDLRADVEMLKKRPPAA
jgi:predicted  nucleic acid-binding Zn-ribbon protein